MHSISIIEKLKLRFDVHIDWREELQTWLTNLRELLRLLRNTNLPRVAIFLVLALIFGAVAIMTVEGGKGGFKDFFASMWWVLVSITTVGYGDIVPTSTLGRIIGSLVILSGVILISTFTATVSSIFVAAKIKEGKGLQQVRYKDHIVVCGAGRIAKQLLETLQTLRDQDRVKVIFIADIPGPEAEELVNQYESLRLKFVRGDWTHEEVLKRASVQEARVVVILPDEKLDDTAKMDEKTILSTLTVKSLNPKVKLLAHIMRRENKAFMQRANADEVLVSDEYTGFLLATNTLATGLPQIISEMLSTQGTNQLASVPIPLEFVGQTFGDLSRHFFEKGSILIGVTREENPLEIADILTADTSSLDEFIRRKFLEAGLDPDERVRTRAKLNPSRDLVIGVKDRAVLIERVGGDSGQPH